LGVPASEQLPVTAAASRWNEGQVSRPCSTYLADRDGAIESRQASAAFHCQSEQVEVGQLAMAWRRSQGEQIGVP
jgi:hypothetical protein